MQETQEADLLLHVVDYADDQFRENTDQVNDVLSEIGADEIPQLTICNKIDRLEGVEPYIKGIQMAYRYRFGFRLNRVQNRLTVSSFERCLANDMVS